MTSDVSGESGEKRLKLIVFSLTIAVFVVVAIMFLFPGTFVLGEFNVKSIPGINAMINSCCACFLLSGFVAIRRKKITIHRACMLTAFALSCTFMVLYVVYHSQTAEPVRFQGTGFIRYGYLFILVTHIVLAAAVLPLALFTISRAWRANYAKHRQIARVTFPMWLYVCLSGVCIYLMLYVIKFG